MEHTNNSKQGLEKINNQKVLKIEELFNEIERIKSEKYGTDIEAIEQKYKSEAAMRRFERNL